MNKLECLGWCGDLHVPEPNDLDSHFRQVPLLRAGGHGIAIVALDLED